MKKMSLEEIKVVQLNILKEVSSFCEKNNINYFLAGGTLLGAIRHKGYIPWDDDIDLLMPRPDYDLFLKLFNKDNNKNIKVLSNEIDSSFPYTFAKVIDCNTYLKENTLLNYPLGINIDIFPIDGFPNDLKKSKRFIRKVGLLKNIYTVKIIKKRKDRNIVKKIILNVAKMFAKPFNILALVKKIILLSKTYKYEECKFVGCLVWGYGIKERVPKFVFENAIDVEFEHSLYKAPVGYDIYLKSLYGDYMKLPPEEKRKTHHSYIAYWK